MSRGAPVLAALLMLGQQAAPARAVQSGSASTDAVSPRNASYSIDVELDPATRAITGRSVLTWRNESSRPTGELQFHLYWNAWRNSDSTWMREHTRAGGALGWRPPEDWSFIEVTALRLVEAGPQPHLDLTDAIEFIAPDDGNEADRTVFRVPLPGTIAPGQTVTLELAWIARVPRTFRRTGMVGNFFFIAHWFPKIGVLQDDGWNTHQFHAGTEFFADYGNYDVRITVPRGWVVGATGREQGRIETPAGRVTHHYRQADVHDFAWTTSPDYLERRAGFENAGLPPVEMRLLLQPEHAGQAERHFDAARAALRFYGEWFGPYPYGHITIVDPAWQSGAGGMEYPTLITAGTRWLNPAGTEDPEGVTIHEAGHQFWYGLVGNNEFEHAWLDEGINTFATARVEEQLERHAFHSMRFFRGFVPWVFRAWPMSREVEGGRIAGYRLAAESDVPSTPSWRYFPATGGAITYNKTALWLHTLERLIGWPRLQRGLSRFFAEHRFRHPTPDDFFRAVGEEAGQDLNWFFDEVYHSSHEFDYGIQQLSTRRAGVTGYVGEGRDRRLVDGEDDPPGRFHSEVVVRRFGEAIFPVDLLVRFEDGFEARERWDGRARWRLYAYDRSSPLVSAEVDPDHVLLLDVTRTNNSATLSPDTAEASRLWAARWLVWLQDLMLTYAFFV